MKKKIILNFFHELNEQYSYAILHHLDDVFDKEGDIDLIVDCCKNDLRKFISTYCDKNNYYFISHTIDLGAVRYNIILFDKDDFIKIELDITYSKNNVLGIDTKHLISKRKEIKGKDFSLYKMEANSELSFYIMKKAFKNQNIDSHYNYLKKLAPNLTKDQIELEYNRNIKHFKTIKFFIKFWCQKVRLTFIRIIEKPSLVISFLGPDGSGKSTIINGIKKNNPFINFKYFHLKPIKTKVDSTKNQIVENPHNEKEYSYIISILKIIYFIIQYNINWFINILPIKVTPALIVFDRYFDDIIADPKRYRYGGPLKFVEISKKFIPKPEITFVLYGPAPIIHSRKKEVSLSELTEQLIMYKKLTENNDSYFLIDVNRPVENIIKEVCMKILKSKNNVS